MVTRTEAPVDTYAVAMSQQTPYALLRARARQRWQELVAGDKPWIQGRITARQVRLQVHEAVYEAFKPLWTRGHRPDQSVHGRSTRVDVP